MHAYHDTNSSQIAKFKFCQYQLRAVSPTCNLMLAKVTKVTRVNVNNCTSISFGNGVILSVDKNQALVGMMDYSETAPGGDPDMDSEEWMVYDERCWFKLLGTHGFNQVHVSQLHAYTYVHVFTWCSG